MMLLSITLVFLCFCNTVFTVDLKSTATDKNQRVVSPEVIVDLTERLDELTIHVADLKRSRDSDAREMAKLNKQLERFQVMRDDDRHVMDQLISRIAELERLRLKDRYVTTQLAEQVAELERNSDGQGLPDDLNVSTSNPVALDDENAEATDEEQTEIRSSKAEQGPFEKRSYERHTRDNPPVAAALAFHARLSHQIDNLSNDQTIKYNQVVTSTGGAHYSYDTGVFTCTMDGVHVFTWSVEVKDPKYAYTALVRNNDVIGANLAGDHYYSSHSASTVAIHLNIGDHVWVRRTGGTAGAVTIRSDRSMFTGFRLGL